MKEEFSPLTIEKLEHYVYTLSDPRTGQVFYVGKGVGNRVFAHVNDALETETESDKLDHIRYLISKGFPPRHIIVRHGMDAKTAFEVEGALIDAFQLEGLKNEVNGHHNNQRGRRDWQDIEIEYGAVPVTIDDPVIILKTSDWSWDKVSNTVKYDNIRKGWWVSGDKRKKIKYALAIKSGIVREVYAIDHWDDNWGITNKKGTACKKDFVGTVAPANIRDKYIHKDVSAYFAIPRLQKAYVNVDDKKKEKNP